MKLFNIFSLLVLVSSSYSSAGAVCFERGNMGGLLPSQICVDIENIDFTYGYLEGSLKISGTYPGTLKAHRELSGEDIYEVKAIIAQEGRGHACSEGTIERAELSFYTTESGEKVSDLYLNAIILQTPDICHTTPSETGSVKYTPIQPKNSSKNLGYKLVLKKFSPTAPETRVIEITEKQSGKFFSANDDYQLFFQPELGKNILITPEGVINLGCFDYTEYSPFTLHTQCTTPSHKPGFDDIYWDYVDFIGFNKGNMAPLKNLQFLKLIPDPDFRNTEYEAFMELKNLSYRIQDSVLILKGENSSNGATTRFFLSSLKPKSSRDLSVESFATLETENSSVKDWNCVTKRPMYDIPGRIIQCQIDKGSFKTTSIHLPE